MNFIATVVLALILAQFLPWWSVMVAGFLSSIFISLKKRAVFFIPFLAIALFWIAHAFWLSSVNDFTLAEKIAVLLPLNGNPYLLILIAGLIGGLAAGTAGVLGKQCLLLLKGNA